MTRSSESHGHSESGPNPKSNKSDANGGSLFLNVATQASDTTQSKGFVGFCLRRSWCVGLVGIHNPEIGTIARISAVGCRQKLRRVSSVGSQFQERIVSSVYVA